MSNYNNYYNYGDRTSKWRTSTDTWITNSTSSITSAASIDVYPYYVTKYEDKIVEPEVIYTFPFKRNSYQSFSKQLQGEFDSWIGNIRKELYA